MELESNPLIEKIASLPRRPVSLYGYVLLVGGQQGETFRLYPRLDPELYYVIMRSHVIDVTPVAGGEEGMVTVLVEGDSDVKRISLESLQASDLNRTQSMPKPAGCSCGCGCGCGSAGGALPGYVYLEKERLRRQIISLARSLLALGVDEFECKPFGEGNTLEYDCCRAWNDLLGAVKKGGSGFEESNEVMAVCMGIG